VSRLELALVTLERAPREVALEGPLRTSEAFLHRVRQWRHTLTGVESVALFQEDRAEFTAALFGAMLANTRVLLPGDALPATLERLRALTPHLIGPFAGALEPHATAAPGELVLSPDAPLSLFTSGTTGAPVVLQRGLRHLWAEVTSHEAVFAPGPCAVHSTVSHQHIYGLLFTVMWPIASGRPFSTRRLAYPEEIEAALTGPSMLITSPAHLKRLPETRWRLPLVAVFSSGGPLPEAAARQTHVVLGCAPTEVYGSSETGGIAWRRRVAGGETWQPFPQVQWRVGESGQLQVCSPHFDGGWFETSDRAHAAPGGFVLDGRVDRIAKVEEKRVSLGAIEQRLLATGLLSDARAFTVEGARVVVAVVGVPTDEGQRLLTQGKQVLVDRLRDELSDAIERVALPRRFRFVKVLPVNAQGKTTDAALRDVLARRRPAARWLEQTALRAVVEFDIDADLSPLEGHFPQAPITPGVAQIDWVVSWACEAFGLRPRLTRLEAIKFQALVVPGHTLRGTLEWHPEKHSVTFVLVRGGEQCASGRLVFEGRAAS
jgi:3-hydroxymyristoyl/3-hydroxydecanoyl-(acyl carrier protein) dehydratase